MTTALLSIAATAVYLGVAIPLLLRLMASNGRLRAQRDDDLDDRATAHGRCQGILDAYELTDRSADCCDMERI